MVEYVANLKLKESDREFISNCLPQEWKTKILNISDETNELHICINAKTKEDTHEWIETYQTLTNACYSIENTKKGNGFHKKRYNCIHKTRHPEKYDPTKVRTTKNLGCPARVTILFRTNVSKNPRCEIKLKFYHNHNINDPKLMKFRKIGPEIKNEMYKLFELGCKPATTIKYLKNIIKLKFKGRYICPHYNYVYNLYRKYTKENKIIDNNYIDNWIENLNKINKNSINNEEKYLNELINKTKTDERYNELVITEDGYVICCCPPIAKRVHQYEIISSEIVFIETINLNSSSIYLFLTPSEIGCLPLGLIVTNSTNISTLQIGFYLLKNKGNINGPKIFVINGRFTEENILQSTWPESKTIISAYHTLKDIWSWLSSPENNITKEDQSLLFKNFHNILYAGNEYTFNINFQKAKTNAKNYENFQILLDKYYNKKELWCTCYRPVNIKKITDIIKYSEITIWFLKDMLRQKLQHLCFAHIADFAVNIFFKYIKQHLIDLTNKKLRNQFYSDIKLPDERILKKIQNIGQSLCFVPSEEEENVIYAVNIGLCKCTCLQDKMNICEHIKWICKLNYTEKLYENLAKMDNRKKCYIIATGQELKEWLIDDDREMYKTTNDQYKIQIIDVDDNDDDVSSSTIKLDDNFVAGVFQSVSNIDNTPNIEDCEMGET